MRTRQRRSPGRDYPLGSDHRFVVRRSCRRRAAPVLLVLLVSLVAAPALAAGASLSPAKTPLQQGKAFYAGKTITFLTDGQPAGPYDLFSRAIAQYDAQYLHATINVVNLTQGTSISAENIAAAAAPTGLQAGVMQLFTPISSAITNTPGVNFNIEREAWINAESAAAQVLIAASSSPYTSIASLVSSPTPVKVIVGAATGLAGALTRGLLGVIHAKVQFVTGYSNTSQEVAGFARGDAPLVMLPLSTAGPLMQSGFAKSVATTLIPYVGTLYRQFILSAPTVSSILKKYPPKTGGEKNAAAALLFIATSPSGLLTLPTKAPAAEVDALRAATDWAYQQSGFKSLMLTDGLSPKLIDPVHAKLAYAASLKKDAALSCYILGTC